MKTYGRFVPGALFVAVSVWINAARAHVFSLDPQLPGEPTLRDLPSLQLHVTLHHQAMALHGTVELQVLANPIVSLEGDRVRYEGYATFVEGPLRTTYALVEGAPYVVTHDSASDVTRVRCIPPSTLPFNDLLPTINALTRIPSASIGGKRVACTSGNLFQTSFGGIPYAICALGKWGYTAFSSAVTMHVDYLDHRVRIPQPKLSDGSSCKATVDATSLTPTGLALLRGSEIPVSTSRMLKEETHLAMAELSCSCDSTPRPCLFFHGLGNNRTESGVQDSSPHFGWEILKDHAPCCITIKYAALNTVDYGWTDSYLQEMVCDRSLSMSTFSDLSRRTIKDTIIVTHSMGGLMFAGALANGRCKLAKSSTWIALSAPMTGSMSSDYLLDFCQHKVHSFVAKLIFEDKCPASASVKSVVYKNEKHSDKNLDTAYAAALKAYRKHVFAAMCSSSYVGNISKYQFKYMMGGSVIPHKSSLNDGLVEFQSCAGGVLKFGDTPDHRFYRCELNHADTAFKTGNGIFKTTVRPVTWFECLL